MNGSRKILLVASLLLLIASCTMDDFLFNNEPIDNYLLPGNTIPDSLIEAVSFESEGNTLYGFWIASNGARPGITMLYCHGNKHNIDEYWDRVMLLHRLGINIFIFDYRGFGKSQGESSESGLYADGEAALNYVLSRTDVFADSICLYGYSLGNVVSIYLSAEKFDPLCLFAEAPFASANSLTQGSSIIDIPPLWLTDGEFNNADRVKGIECPFMLIHGEDDDFVRYRDNGKIVYDNAPEPKLLALVSGAHHDDIPEILGDEQYLHIIENWIDESINF